MDNVSPLQSRRRHLAAGSRGADDYGRGQIFIATAAVAGGIVIPGMASEGLEVLLGGGEALGGEAVAAQGGTPRAYSVAFETTLSEGSLAGSRASHFAQANEALYNAVHSSPELAESMRELGVEIEPGARGAFPRKPPAGWTWHHELEPGVMRLVPRAEHTVGSQWWDVLHPGGQGGYSIWGR